ncbi:MAG TPA: TolC family protein [Bacteroidia bacterium]|jgi:outer membrane protein|nr:TolC family protein [Bacteroidia bacterium]HMU19136.1 TolC family protein [Bacteroidia bacterium]
MLNQIKFLTGFLLLISINIQAQQSDKKSYSFSLKQALDFAFQNQTDIQNAVLDQKSAQSRANELLGIGLPQVSASADITHFIDIPTTFVPAEFFGGEKGSYAPVQFGQPYSSTAGLSASQLLFDGSYLVGVKASRMYADLMRKQVVQTKTEKAALISKAYYNVQVNSERLQMLDANVKRLKKQLDEMQVMYNNGFIEKIDLDRISLAYNNIETEKANADRLIVLAQNLLKFQIGLNVSDELILTDKLEDVKVVADNSLNQNIDISNRIEMDVLNTTKELLKADLRLKKSSYLPSLAAFGSYSVSASRNDFDIFENKPWFRTSIIGVKLNVPIFDGFQKAARVNQARFTLNKMENQIRTATQGFELEAQTAKTTLTNALGSLASQEKNRTLAADVARITKIKYQQGVGSSLEVMDAETALKVAETNYYAAMVDAFIAKVDFEKATGTLIK